MLTIKVQKGPKLKKVVPTSEICCQSVIRFTVMPPLLIVVGGCCQCSGHAACHRQRGQNNASNKNIEIHVYVVQ